MEADCWSSPLFLLWSDVQNDNFVDKMEMRTTGFGKRKEIFLKIDKFFAFWGCLLGGRNSII
jgi:hypothetical protein